MLTLACALLALAACDRSPSTRFDGQAALRYAQAQVAFGPRVPGTEAHRRGGDWIAEQMRQRADTVIEQRWTHVTSTGDTLPMHNIFARFNPGAASRILYVVHWDSRPVSENARDEAKRKLPVPGANDGAAGVGLLVALGDVLKQSPPNIGVDLLFVDGEDYGQFGPPDVDVLIGSTYFANNMPPEYRPIFGVLWDMIGDADLQIHQEGNSVEKAPEVVSRVWETAARLGYARYFVPETKYTVTDDHIPLLAKGIRIIDVIDLDYPHHHTPEDTIDKISARSLQVIGDVAVTLIRDTER